MKYLNVSTLVTILRCPRAHYRAVWSSLSTITSYKGEPCTLIVLHLGGTIQSSQKALVKHNAAVLKREVSSAKTGKRIKNEWICNTSWCFNSIQKTRSRKETERNIKERFNTN